MGEEGDGGMGVMGVGWWTRAHLARVSCTFLMHSEGLALTLGGIFQGC